MGGLKSLNNKSFQLQRIVHDLEQVAKTQFIDSNINIEAKKWVCWDSNCGLHRKNLMFATSVNFFPKYIFEFDFFEPYTIPSFDKRHQSHNCLKVAYEQTNKGAIKLVTVSGM